MCATVPLPFYARDLCRWHEARQIRQGNAIRDQQDHNQDTEAHAAIEIKVTSCVPWFVNIQPFCPRILLYIRRSFKLFC